MRITARVHAYPPASNAGAEWMLAPMLSALAARGHQVEVHLSNGVPGVREPWDLDGVRVMPPGTVAAGPRPDVYVTHLDNTRRTAAAARGRGVPLVVVQHNTHDLARQDLAVARPSLLVLNSEWMAAELGYQGRSIVVRPPVLREDYETVPGTAVTLINLTSGKGGPLLWDLAARMPGTEFLAVKGSYGEQAVPDPVPPNVTVLDTVDGRLMRDQVYARTRILLVPSDYESWGRVATEAMCSGIPVIAHKAAGALTENLGDAAIWADRDDPAEWEAQITLLSDPAQWEAASEACRERAAELDPAADLEQWCDAVEALAR
jgi:glycosyltransferase involved in cell wall biosynthesis